MIVDLFGQRSPAFRGDVAAMLRNRGGDINRSPSQKPAPPGQVCIFPIGEKILIEIPALDGHVIEGVPPIHRRCAAWSKDFLGLFELAVIGLFGASIQMALLAE